MNSRLEPSLFGGRYYVLTQLRRHMKAIAADRLSGNKGCLVVDFGCGEMPYRSIFETPSTRYIGIDFESNPAADLHPLITGAVPLGDGVADVVLSTQVLEHVPDPRLYLQESLRLLKQDGLLILSTHGNWMYHPHPIDLWRWTGAGLRNIIETSGYKVIDCKGIMGLASSGAHLFQDGLMCRLPGFARPVLSLLAHPVIALSDALASDRERQNDAAVFVVVAEKVVA